MIPRELDVRPRVALLDGPTPLTRAARLSEALGVEVWVKRDDVGSPAFAGNKIRKLEYLIGDALATGADTLVTTGARQSNSARAAAAAAVACGIRPVLLLEGDAPEVPTGNLVVDLMVGAEVRFLGHAGWEALEAAVEETAAALRREGAHPVTVPVGCSSPLGALGLTRAWFELVDQLAQRGIDATAVYHASTSGGTHAGLTLGRTLSGHGPLVRGVSAGRVQDDPAGHHRDLALAAAGLLGVQVDGVPVDVAITPSSTLGPWRRSSRRGERTAPVDVMWRLAGDPVGSGRCSESASSSVALETTPAVPCAWLSGSSTSSVPDSRSR